jgi:hypothetical protein
MSDQPCNCAEAKLYRRLVQALRAVAEGSRTFHLFGVAFAPVKDEVYQPRHAKPGAA